MNKVLHITNWYPNKWNPHEAGFIKEHFKACENYAKQELWHIQIRNDGHYFSFFSGDYSENEHYLILDTKIQVYRFQEILTLLLLIVLRMRLRKKWWDVTNVHIAYPLLRFTRIFKYMFGSLIIITEHWSAFRNSFFLPNKSKAARRIANIFSYNLPLIAVSKALMSDIVNFSGYKDFPKYIIPNVVDPDIFHPGETELDNVPVFLMVASWTPIKRPFLAMEAFSEILNDFPEAKLRIVGSGYHFKEMKDFVNTRKLQNSIQLLGPMDKYGIAKEMRQAKCFLHASDYETFSVVCAEALSCGVPVIASNVGGIPEFVNDENGMLVENTHLSWTSALKKFISGNFVKKNICEGSQKTFHPKTVGKRLMQIYEIIIAESGK